MALEKTFSPNKIEKKWYSRWESEGHFKPRPGRKGEAFCIIMPPPNVTGILHMGHALDVTTQDILIRYKRMKGYDTLWLPGMDHAGIATQSVVEKKLQREEGKSRRNYSREEFLDKVWDWKKHHGGMIQEQQRALGSSCDWSYSLFTMDQDANKAVNRAFVDLYNEGLIVQSDYIVNWDYVLQTAISDAEVVYHEIKGAYYYIKYQIKDLGNSLTIATTRPETMLGDTAIAVHPEDDRFKQYIGKMAIVPLCGREIPIIGDSYVDREKGTGCLKVTPGHDFNDFDLGRRHELPIIKILNKDGTLNDYGLQWKGILASKARELIVNELEKIGLFVGKEDITHTVGHGERSKAVIEPMVSKQWFLKTKKMARVAREAVEKNDTRFFPKSWENTYFSWLREPRDWCISRQLWWGHRIPVFTCQSCSHQWAHEEVLLHCPKCRHHEISQDPDVLDTWFSSSLWPLTILGWPDQSLMKEKGFDRFYPTSVLITGYDIIFFWVARMMMMGIKHVDKIPFHHVYIHAIVRDKYGRKMSKSLGNGIDPLEVCEKYGADSLRFALAADSGYNQTINLDPAKIEGYRNFINKLWNAFRFIEPFLKDIKLASNIQLNDHQDRWILGELNLVAKKMNEAFDEYRFDDACLAIYQFTYEKFCSWYIEFSKPILYSEDESLRENRIQVLYHCLKKMMILLHPIAPFISEEIWKYLRIEGAPLLIEENYLEYRERDTYYEDQSQMNRFIEVITKIRSLRQGMGLPLKQKIPVEIFTDDRNFHDYIKEHETFLSGLAILKELSIKSASDDRPRKSIMSATSYCEIFIPLDGIIDIDDQRRRIQKDIDKVEKELQKFVRKISNKGFMDKAPQDIIFETQEKVKKYEQELKNLQGNLSLLR